MTFEQPNLHNEEDKKEDADRKKTPLGHKLAMWSSIAAVAAGLGGDGSASKKAEATQNSNGVELATPEIDAMREDVRKRGFETVNTPGVGANYFRTYNSFSENNQNVGVTNMENGTIAMHNKDLFLRGVNLNFTFSKDTGEASGTAIKTAQESGFSIDGLAPGYEMVSAGDFSTFEAKGSTEEKALERALEQAARYFGVLVDVKKDVRDTTKDSGKEASINSSAETKYSALFNTPIKEFRVESTKKVGDDFVVTIKVQAGEVVKTNHLNLQEKE